MARLLLCLVACLPHFLALVATPKTSRDEQRKRLKEQTIGDISVAGTELNGGHSGLQ
uniref:Uncharacterized protein n=2 Tax=Oryza sativa subsp. japonica TaxID=39947 RepID=A0A5S6RDH2_ORYSJ|nr:Hypothetical protein [Oryza sativa Japonica Group]AAP53701.1 hypothetical protein LOC_Os10g26740 [Oryza sativa Japonica Group]